MACETDEDRNGDGEEGSTFPTHRDETKQDGWGTRSLGRCGEQKRTKTEAGPHGMTSKKGNYSLRIKGSLRGQFIHFGVGGDEGEIGHVEEEAVFDYSDDLTDGCS